MGIIYETWCLTCEKKEKEKIEEMELDEEEKLRLLRKVRLHKYVGETSRSLYERGLEHLRDLNELKQESHMLKHYFDHHPEEELEKMEFGAKIIKAARTAFNRQVGESVYIQENAANHAILNSKSEYNRCALPRLTTKMGDTTVDKEIEKMKKMKKEEIEKERELMKKIRDLKVHQSNRRREIVSSKIQPAAKRRKINKEEFKRVQQDERQSKKRIDEERKDVAENYFPIFKRAKKNTPEEENEKEKLETEEKEINVEERIESEEERTNKEIEDEKIKEERKRRAEKLSKGWELFKICK